MQQMKEAMMSITQRQSAPTLVQPVLPQPTAWALTDRQQYIAPPVKPIPCEQICIAREWANMLTMTAIRIKARRKNASTSIKQKEKQRAKMPHQQEESKQDLNRMSRGHGK